MAALKKKPVKPELPSKTQLINVTTEPVAGDSFEDIRSFLQEKILKEYGLTYKLRFSEIVLDYIYDYAATSTFAEVYITVPLSEEQYNVRLSIYNKKLKNYNKELAVYNAQHSQRLKEEIKKAQAELRTIEKQPKAKKKS